MRITALLIIVMLFAACGSESEPEPTRAVMPTFTATAVPPAVAPATMVPPTLPLPTATPPPIVESAPAPIIVPTDTVQPAQVVQGAMTTDVANLRSGPGIDFGVVGSLAAGQPIVIVGRNAAGDWYQLSDGTWIAAFLVSGASADLTVVDVPTIQQPPVVVETLVVEQPSTVPAVSTVENNVGVSSPAFVCVGGCAVPPDPSCAIKGNVNSEGEKIYHTTDSSFYDRTDIKPDEGDRWFCTSQEAVDAGFRAPQSR